jgi:repressor LexA
MEMRNEEPDGPGGPGLAPIQQRIVQFTKEFQQSRGCPPSIREIGDAVGLASTSTVVYHVSALEEQARRRRGGHGLS